MTTDLRDRIVTIVAGLRAVDYDEIFPSDYETADELIAALPGMVKPLKWEDARFSSRHPRETAESMFGIYEVMQWEQGGFGGSFPVIYPNDRRAVYVGTKSMDEAKAAADTHYRAQIMAAFGIPTPPQEDRTDG